MALAKRLSQFAPASVWTEFTPLAIKLNAVNLGQGFPNWKTPAFVKDAAKLAVDQDFNQYARSAGQPLLSKPALLCCQCQW